MLIVWRGYGWLVPIIVVASFLVAQLSVDTVYGEDYYRVHEWPKILAIVTGSILVGLFGFFINYKKREEIIDQLTGKIRKSPAHTLFFIPVEFWAIILPAIFFLVINLYSQAGRAGLCVFICSTAKR